MKYPYLGNENDHHMVINLITTYWLVVSTHLKNISQNGNLPQFGGEN